jgi:hypothetical protein
LNNILCHAVLYRFLFVMTAGQARRRGLFLFKYRTVDIDDAAAGFNACSVAGKPAVIEVDESVPRDVEDQHGGAVFGRRFFSASSGDF